MITTKQRTGRLRPAREYEVFAVAGLIGVAAFLLLIAALWVWPITPDGLFHLHRVAALRSALAAGVFYPRWFPEFAFGYGYPVLNFYAPAFYYPPALLTLAGVDVVWATRLTLAAIYALSGAAAYLAGRLWVRPLPALLGAIIYLAFPYRLYDLVVRGALPEFAAFLWLPLLAWAAGAAARAAREDASARHSIMQLALPTLMAAVASAGLIATHNLTALMAAIATGFLVLALVVIGRRRAGLWITGVALLSAPHTLPALAETRWLGFMATSLGRGYATHWASWHDLWSWSPLYIYPNAADAVVPLPGWVALVLVAGLAVALTPWGRRRRAILLSGIVILAILIWLMTSTSVQLWDIAASVLGVIQFPWRWQALLAGATAAAAAVTADDLTNSSPSPRAAVLTTLLMALAGVYVVAGAYGRLPQSAMSGPEADVTTTAMWAFDAEHGQVGATWSGEFTPRWVREQRWAIGRAPTAPETLPPLPGGVTITPNSQGYTSIVYAVTAMVPFTLTLDRFYYPAWHVQAIGQKVPTGAAGSLGLLAAAIPAGAQRVTVAWGATPAVWAGRGRFTVGWLAVLALLWVSSSRMRLALLGVWLAFGIAAALAATDVLAAEVQPRATRADFGPAVLTAAWAPHSRPGEIAQVRLYWTVEEASDSLTAFVHLVDGSGQVIAQHDGPLGGEFMPSSRWLPGMALETSHSVALPVDLAPGGYRLKAGVYRPGEAQAPLLPAGRDDPRVDIGTLEIRR